MDLHPDFIFLNRELITVLVHPFLARVIMTNNEQPV
jgi:hypothetical protein